MDGMKGSARVRLKITGRVQGVYFRASAMQEARGLRLTGWVMHCPDSTVEIVAEGEKDQLKKLIDWCRGGPPGAQVKEISVEWETSKQEFHSFSIRR
jgi:acylphosphatase